MKALIDHYGYVPESCVWELTRACNLRCGHCGTAAGRPRPNELSHAEAIDVAHQLARLGNRLTTLSGGEPTLRKDWVDIARALVAAGVTVNMVTNGQGDGQELARQAKDAGLANIAVSLDGLEPTHDALRGQGAYARSVETIRALVAAGIWIDVMLTVNRKNITEIIDTWELTKRLGAKRFRVQLGKPMGNQTHRDDLTLRPEDLLTLLPLLGNLAGRRGPAVRIGDSVGFYSPEERVLRGRETGPRHWTGCYAGVRAIGIQADGGVKGCLSLQPRTGEADRFVEGNLREESLEAIWFRPGAFAYNREFELGKLKGACAKCTHATLCRGGATCVAYAFTGELGCDPMCYYQVAGLSEATRQRVWPASAQAAAAALMLSIGGCSAETEGSSDPSSVGGSSASLGGGAGSAFAQTGGVPTATLDYGIWEPEGGSGGLPVSVGGSGGEPLAQPDYGVGVPEGGTGGQAVSAGGSGGQAVSAGGSAGQVVSAGGSGGEAPSTGGSGGEPIVYPDYGVTPPEGGAGGQVTATGGAGGEPIAYPEYGVMPPEGGSGGEPMVYPDYGVTPPEGGASGAAGQSGVDCTNVCCDCDYGAPPPRECCE